MTDTPELLPKKEGFYWAKWRIATGGTPNGDELTPCDDWEVVHVVVNGTNPKSDDYLRVSVCGVQMSQCLDGFFWGPMVNRAAPPTPANLEAMASPAETALRNYQRQLDIDGVEVGVSRQALDEVLAELQAIRTAHAQGLQQENAAWQLQAQAQALDMGHGKPIAEDVKGLVERLSSDEFITLECLNYPNHHKYSYDVEAAASIIQAFIDSRTGWKPIDDMAKTGKSIQVIGHSDNIQIPVTVFWVQHTLGVGGKWHVDVGENCTTYIDGQPLTIESPKYYRELDTPPAGKGE